MKKFQSTDKQELLITMIYLHVGDWLMFSYLFTEQIKEEKVDKKTKNCFRRREHKFISFFYEYFKLYEICWRLSESTTSKPIKVKATKALSTDLSCMQVFIVRASFVFAIRC